MADVFISYSSKDRDIASRFAARLEAEGYSVWWDTKLAGGDSFDRQIDHELRQARAVLVIWTRSSIESRWVRAEAINGFERDVLVSVRADDAVPPIPFNRVHTSDASDVDRILQRVSILVRGDSGATRATPQSPRREPPRAAVISASNLRSLQLAAAYWIGIVGAIITLVGNLEAFVKLAIWIKFVFRHWSEIITLIWRTLIPWRIHISPEDAVVLTLIVILFFNLLVTSRHKDVDVRTRGRDGFLLVTGVIAVAYLGFVGFADKYDPQQLGLVNTAMIPLRTFLEGINGTQFVEIASFGSMIVAGAAVMSVAYVPFAVGLDMRPNVNAYAVRLWRILMGVGIALVVNQISLVLEGEEWRALIQSAG